MAYRIVVAVSGRGSNLKALADALSGHPNVTIATVVADHPVPALNLAADRGIATRVLRDFRDGQEWCDILAESQADLLVLAGYLKLVPADVVRVMTGRIINIHPALLPGYGGTGMYGKRVHQAVIAAGEKISGATVHLVDEEYDRGEILGALQVAVMAEDTPETLATRVLAVNTDFYQLL